ncbi:class I SAM-dependent methyltransferase [Nonomuraea roseoviolacea subsp. roseoviolacea]|uniref:SAM-dependent methyltransferase n=1 Tax=Nonomuraea roseoviolacea subsp. carminata TaxID=160689 RepID=A0ABT1K4S1_9ACTN|nr:class I SAM-dependent methyltransferase [Nonomuraea roseoviolacea]MCP2348592.1 SAM-dependent methyltransferase [Nonomuraea roseoviolacea subsp. carminata]
MTFNHNDHYHPLLTRQIPRGARRALDVGCGTGRFARTLAARGLDVDAVDPDKAVIDAATGQGIRYIHGDITTMELEPGRYDYISCLASLHHVPFDTVRALRSALAPGGVLAVLGCYRASAPSDYLFDVVAIPANAAMRLALSGRPAPEVDAPVTAPRMTLEEIRREAATLLPGVRIRRLLFWRYLLTFQAQ